MDLIQRAALHKFKLTKEEQAAIPARDTPYEFDFLVRARGTLKKCEDKERDATCSIPHLTTLAVLIQHMGVTREVAIEKIVSAMESAHEFGKDANDELLKHSGVLEALQLVKDKIISRLPKTHVNGSLLGTPVFELVGIVEETHLETGEVLTRVVS